MKKLLFVFTITALLAAGCNSSQQASNQTPVIQNTTPVPTAAPTPIKIADWETYINTEYGFQITFPNNAWQNYKVSFLPDSLNTKFDFQVPDKNFNPNDERYWVTPFTIHATTQAYWKQLYPKQNNKSIPGYLEENQNYVFSYDSWQEPPVDFNNVDFELQKIVNSFSLLNWIIYKNEKFGYAFKYPKGWYVLPLDNGALLITSSPNTKKYYSHGAREPLPGSMEVDFAPNFCSGPTNSYEPGGGLHGIAKIVCVKNNQFALTLSDQDPDLNQHQALLETIPTTLNLINNQPSQ